MVKKKAADEAAETEVAETGDEEAGTAEAQGGGWNNEQEHTLAVDRLETMAEELELNTKEMVFDVRDFLLDLFKSRPKPWSGTSQAEQRDIAAACEHTSNELVRKVVEAVAARGVEPVRVLLTKVTLGSDLVISGKVKAFTPEEEDRAVKTLHHALNKFVMLTVATTEDYKGGDRDPETDADEPDFEFEGEGDSDAYEGDDDHAEA